MTFLFYQSLRAKRSNLSLIQNSPFTIHFVKDCFATSLLAMTSQFYQSLRAKRSNLSLIQNSPFTIHFVKDCFATSSLTMTFFLPVVANKVKQSFSFNQFNIQNSTLIIHKCITLNFPSFIVTQLIFLCISLPRQNSSQHFRVLILQVDILL